MKWRKIIGIALLSVLTGSLNAQEQTPVASIDIPAQNLLKFNRFLINPTFSTVNEDQSYLNFYHRNQWIKFDDNYQTYLASYSGRIGDRTGLGLSVYHQKFATISNFGLIANYAYGVRLAEKTKLTFGFNLSYYDSGIDPDGINPSQPNDPLIAELDGSSLLTFQPGFNLSLGSFDVGLYAEDLFDFNLKEGSSLTSFGEKTFTGHLMYTKRFENAQGMLEGGKMSVLSRVRRPGEGDVNLSGSLIFDVPKIGWVQAGYDDFYGIAGGIGFNLTKRLSLGYTIEKGIEDQISNFGVTHEINFAYSFQPNLSENRVLKDIEEDTRLVDQLKPADSLETDKDKLIAELQKKVAENDMIIEEMMFRQDSIEEARNKDIDRRFAYLLKFIKDNDTPERQEDVRREVAAAVKALKEDKEYELPVYENTERSKSKNTKEKPRNQGNRAVAGRSEAKDRVPSVAAVGEEKRALSFTATKDIEGVASGYYAIVNVFSKDRYRDAFMQKLADQGVRAGSFSKNGLHYVFVDRYDNATEARNAYEGNFDGRYDGNAWVLRVKGDSANDYGTSWAVTSNKIDKGPKRQETSGDDTSYVITSEASGSGSCTGRYVANLIRDFKMLDRSERPSEAFAEGTSGYYIVANVFSEDLYAKKYVDSLQQKGIQARIYENPRNKYKYVYIKKYSSWKEATTSLKREGKKYNNKQLWIMPIGSS